MHIPENYLSPSTCAVMTIAMAPVLYHSIKKVKAEVSKEKLPLLGVGAALSFVAMMFNVPIFGGSSGHAVGGTLIAILLGPEAACLSVSIALILQAVLFGDGGILAIGANCFNMAFVMPFVGYYVYRFIKNKIKGEKGAYLGAAIGSYIAINMAALCTAIEFGVQPMLFIDTLGNPLYCPYPLMVAVPAMMLEHLTLFGAVEAVFTVGVYAYVKKMQPELLNEENENGGKSLNYLLAGLIALVPLGLLATGTAFGEWGNEELMDMLGYVPKGMEGGFSFNSIMPDYAIEGLPDVLTYYLSAIIGVGLLIIIFKLLANFKKKA